MKREGSKERQCESNENSGENDLKDKNQTRERTESPNTLFV
jgi:hypothetical protein